MEVPVRVEIEQGERVLLTWEDGSRTTLTGRRLREACWCALCGQPEGEEATARVLAGPEPIRIASAELVGNYGISFIFEPDGHHTGIFPFDGLARLGR